MAIKVCHVKNGGTLQTTTPYSAIQTGVSFTTLTLANCYDSINDAHTYETGLSAGDYVISSHQHNKDYGSTTTIIDFVDGVFYISCNDSDAGAYLAGAIERTTGGNYDLQLYTAAEGTTIFILGYDFRSSDDIYIGDGNCNYHLIECSFQLTGTSSADGIYLGLLDADILRFTNPTFTFGNSSQEITGNFGAEIILDNMTLAGSALVNLFASYGNGGCHITVNNSDLSSVTGALCKATVLSSDRFWLTLNRCKKGATNSIFGGDPIYDLEGYDLYGCDNGDGYHVFEHGRNNGTALEELSIYRTTGDTYDGTNEFSVEITTTSKVKKYINPLRIPLKVVQRDVDTAAITFKWHLYHFRDDDLALPVKLTNHTLWVEGNLPSADTGDMAKGQRITTIAANIFATETDIPTGSEAWTDAATPTYSYEYELSITIPQTSGADNVGIDFTLCLAQDVTNATNAESLFVDTAADES